MTLSRLSIAIAFSSLAFGCAPPPPAESGDQSSDVHSTDSKPHAPPSGPTPTPTPDPSPMPPPGPSSSDHGLRPSGSLLWNRGMEGSGTATTTVLSELLLRADGTMAEWAFDQSDGTPQTLAQLFHGTYTFSKQPKQAADTPAHPFPVDDHYQDVVNGVKDDASAYLITLTLTDGTAQTYSYYLETDGTWHLRYGETSVWFGLNPATDNGNAVVYCETQNDCTTGTCTPAAAGPEPKPSTCM